jgi:hypothetical protein
VSSRWGGRDDRIDWTLLRQALVRASFFWTGVTAGLAIERRRTFGYLLSALDPMQLPDVDEAVIDPAKFARNYLTADLGSPTSRTTPSE